MKKLIKNTVLVMVIGFVFLGAGLTALAANGYIVWGGSDAKDHMLITFDNINKNIVRLKADNEGNKQIVSDLKQTIKDKEQTIKDKEQGIKDKQQEVNDKQKELENKQKEIAEKQKEIDEMKKNQTANSDQLKQAEADIKMLDKEADKLLEASK